MTQKKTLWFAIALFNREISLNNISKWTGKAVVTFQKALPTFYFISFFSNRVADTQTNTLVNYALPCSWKKKIRYFLGFSKNCAFVSQGTWVFLMKLFEKEIMELETNKTKYCIIHICFLGFESSKLVFSTFALQP